MPSRRKQKRSRNRRTPLESFFANYAPAFRYDPTESASHAFYRLCDDLGWERGDDAREVAHRAFKNALVRQFNAIYGTDEDDLDAWQRLCRMVDVEPVPDDLEDCREAIQGTYVNLVDLVDKDVKLFDSERELSQYTRATGKYFPKENAYAGGLLRYLLRHILNPVDYCLFQHLNTQPEFDGKNTIRLAGDLVPVVSGYILQ